jgi:hypothetical protein
MAVWSRRTMLAGQYCGGDAIQPSTTALAQM